MEQTPTNSNEPGDGNDQSHGGQKPGTTPVVFPDRIDQVVRTSIRLYTQNIFGLVRLSIYITIPFAFAYFFLYMAEDSTPASVQIIILGLLSMLRNNLLEAAITLILPSLLYQNASINNTFLMYFLRNTAPRIIIWTIVFSLFFFIINLIIPIFGVLLLFLTLFIIPLITLGYSKPIQPKALFKDNAKLIGSNPFLALASTMVSNLVLFVPAGILLLIFTLIFISPEDLEGMLQAFQESNLDEVNSILAGSGGNSKIFIAVSIIEVLLFPLKFLVFSTFCMFLMKRYLPQRLNSFFNSFGLHIVNINNTPPTHKL